MKHYIGLRLLLCLAVLVAVTYSLYPLRDIPFDAYLKKQVTAHAEEFNAWLAKADQRLKAGEAPSIFVALKELAEEEGIDYTRFFTNIKLADLKDVTQRNNLLLNHLLAQSRAKLKQGLDLKGGVAFTLEAVGLEEEAALNQTSGRNMQKAVEILRKRVDALGVAEPIIRARGTNQIEVQLAGISTQENPEVINLLKKPAKLEFRLVHPDRRLVPGQTPLSQYPMGYVPLSLEAAASKGDGRSVASFFVKQLPEMTGKAVKEARVVMNAYGTYEVTLALTAEGTQQFREITRSHLGEALAIVLDGKLYCAPVIRSEISNGNASISGSFTQREAFELANVLNNPLEFELKLTEAYEVGPSLAKDACDSSIKAALLGAGLVLLFMVMYYLIMGGIAIVSILFNVVIVLGVLAAIGATLTLPAIAGLALTVGMGVDANILIFERIREELRRTHSLSFALQAAHTRAFATIIDANLTTLLTAGILIVLGTGPIKGFGVTLSIGIVASLFCVLLFSKVLLEYMVRFKPPIRWLLPFNLFRGTRFNFLRYIKPIFIFSWLLIFVGVGVMWMRGSSNYALDFSGGDEITVESRQALDFSSIEALARRGGVGPLVFTTKQMRADASKAVPQTVGLKIQTPMGKGRLLFNALDKAYPEAELALVGETYIGASVTQSIKKNAVLSVLIALLGILMYVACRFEFAYGMGALVSTFHDILLTVGIFVLLGGKVSGSMISALLMIIGYSINDTIVVFDRIREELQLQPNASLPELVNLAINRTLSRTLLTSFTTFLSALALVLFGAGDIVTFAWVFMIGIVVGTFSSIFIASPVFLWWRRIEQKRPPHALKPASGRSSLSL